MVPLQFVEVRPDQHRSAIVSQLDLTITKMTGQMSGITRIHQHIHLISNFL